MAAGCGSDTNEAHPSEFGFFAPFSRRPQRDAFGIRLFLGEQKWTRRIKGTHAITSHNLINDSIRYPSASNLIAFRIHRLGVFLGCRLKPPGYKQFVLLLFSPGAIDIQPRWGCSMAVPAMVRGSRHKVQGSGLRVKINIFQPVNPNPKESAV